MFKIAVCLALFAVALGLPQKGLIPRRNFGGKIVGGDDADISDFPYQVSFRFYGEHFCGGSIIDETTIVTAAHCTDGLMPDRMTIMVGSDRVDGGQEYKVDYYSQHPLYNEDTTDYDVSILKLEVPLTFSDNVQPIEIQGNDEEVEAGTVATVSGWGATFENDEDTPDILQKVDVDVISHKECQEAFINPNRITARMLCAKSLGKDSCQGDSGGPLVANGKLIGVVSWGIGCARPRYPGIYSKVSNLHRWIEQNK